MTFRTTIEAPNDGSGRIAAGCGVLFGLVFAAAGILFFVIAWKTLLGNLDSYSWKATPCELQSAEVLVDFSNQDNPFELSVSYRYAFGDREYQGTRYQPDGLAGGGDDYSLLDRRRLALEADGDGDLICYVNPEDPSQAVLERGSLLTGLFLLMPLVFVAIGLGVAVFSIRFVKKWRSHLKRGGISGSARGSRSGGRKAGWIIFGILFIVGGALLYPLLIRPVSRAADARSWPETECGIIWSRVRGHHSDDGTTYSVDIFYEYAFAGRDYKSNRYSFIGGSSTGSASKRDIVKRYPKGSKRVCWVNPNDPLEAVLKRELGLGALLGLIPSVLLLIGGIGLVVMARGKGAGKKGVRQMRWAAGGSPGQGFRSQPTPPPGAPSDREVQLKPGGKRLLSLAGMFFITLFWNGIVSVFLWQIVDGFKRGSSPWFLVVFMVPFVLVGIGLVLAFIYTLLSQFNPRPVITLRPGRPGLGGRTAIEWRIPGGAGRIRKFELSVEARESATYRRGTNSHTDTEVFYRRVIGTAEHAMEMHRGRGAFSLPDDLPASLNLDNNKIEWALLVKGDIPFWPDVDDRHPIEVIPGKGKHT